jgi:hypothetical protein
MASDPAVTEAMRPYWTGSFVALDAVSRSHLATWANQMAYLTLWDGFGPTEWPLWIPVLLLGCAVGTVRTWIRRPADAVLLVFPLVAGLVASALGLYPVSLRLWLWALPILMLLVLAGAYAAAGAGGGIRGHVLVVALMVSIVASRGARSFTLAHTPNLRAHARPLLEELDRFRLPDEPVYVFARSAAVWNFYRTPPPEHHDWLRRFMKLASPGGPAFENDTIMGPASEREIRLLQSPAESGLVFMGRSSGSHVRLADDAHLRVDPDWAPAEAGRFLAAVGNGGCGWVFELSATGRERQAFDAELQKAQARMHTRILSEGPLPPSTLRRVCLPRARSDP